MSINPSEYHNCINLQWQQQLAFVATDSQGHSVAIDAATAIGGQNSGSRPMDMVLMGLAGCAAIDVLLILQKGRFNVESCNIQVLGKRVQNEIPKVFSDILLLFSISGDIPTKRLEQAISLSVEKYCSVAKMLRPNVSIDWQIQ